MTRPSIFHILVLGALATTSCVIKTTKPGFVVAAEDRAIEFLKREVPAWSRDNGCFSCHNNGDAARALYSAASKGYRIPPIALADTTDWVSNPERWSHNKGDPGFSDQRLADVQFAASLASALESRALKDDKAMEGAANKVAQGQAADGSWPIDAANPVGSPATYGATLATYMAWDSLRRVPVPETFGASLKAEEKLRTIKPDSVPNAAVLILFLEKNQNSSALVLTDTLSPTGGEGRMRGQRATGRFKKRDGVRAQPTRTNLVSSENAAAETAALRSCLDFLRRAQTGDGGWGPYADSPPEAFDTALALLALAEVRGETGVSEMIRRGRAFLVGTQLLDGSWPATTRPSGGQSYAQQMSTAGWATLALLATH